VTWGCERGSVPHERIYPGFTGRYFIFRNSCRDLSAGAEHPDCWDFCEAILPEVSRSFALIIPKCPDPIDRGLCVGYLICRTADTIEDHPTLTEDQRAVLYDALLSAVDDPADAARVRVFHQAWPTVPENDCNRLIAGFARVLAAYRALPAELGPPIRHCVHEMVAGMRSMGPVETRNGIAFLCRDLAELEEYCHYVAGTVGVMSTALFEMRFDPGAFTPTDQWREDGRRLGLGLQMTNIIKDCRVDAARGSWSARGAGAAGPAGSIRGVSFIPAGCVDLTQASYRLHHSGRAKLIGCAIRHLDAGLRYVLAIPTAETGIRTFLLGSLLPAIATLEVAAPGTEEHPKISRAKMTEIFSRIDRHLADDHSLAAWYAEHRCRTLALLSR